MCSWGATFTSYLAYGTQGGKSSGSVELYEGIQWSFTAKCTPEPMSVVSGLVGLGMIGAWVRKQRKV